MAYIQQIARGKSCSYKGFQQKGLIKQTYTVSDATSSSNSSEEPYLGGKPTSKMTKEELMNHPNSPTNKYKNKKPESFTIYKDRGSMGRGKSGTRRTEEVHYEPDGKGGYEISRNVVSNPDFKEKIDIELNMPTSSGKSTGATNYSGRNPNAGNNQSFCTAAKGGKGSCLKP